MAVDDLWYLSRRGPNDERLRSKRYGRGKRWRVRYTDPHTGRPKTELFAKQSDAELHDANMRADISQGKYVDPKAGRVTVQAYAESWIKNKVCDANTRERIESTLRMHVYPVLGHHKLGPVVPSHIKGWVSDRSRVLAASTLTVAYNTVLHPLFESAVSDKKIGTSPCVGIELPNATARKYHIIKPEQVAELAEALPEDFRAVPWIAAGCGLRGGEIMGLEEDAVSAVLEQINVFHQLKKLSARRMPFLDLPKNKTARSVDLPAHTAGVIAQHTASRAPVVLELDTEVDPRKVKVNRVTGERTAPKRPVRLLFTYRGRPVLRGDWSRIWVPAVAKAGLPEGYRLHDMRHFYASTLIHHGASVKTVQLALGHASAATTYEYYIHEWPDLADRTRTIMDRAFGHKPK